MRPLQKFSYLNQHLFFHLVFSTISIERKLMTKSFYGQVLKQTSYSCLIVKRFMLKNSINHILNKKVMDRYVRLPMPNNKILATYCWIDGSGLQMRSKDRILNSAPTSAETAPRWAFDGSSCMLAKGENSDTSLLPVSIYRDPFRMEPHVIVLCEVYQGSTGKPVSTNHRRFCNDLCKLHAAEDPWFGIEQEYTMLDIDGWGLGWPKGGGFPVWKHQYSYCGVGGRYVLGRDIAEAHTKASLYAGCDLEGTNAEVAASSWEWQVGVTKGIKAPDDLWMTRYIMSRVTEDYGIEVTYHPKPFGLLQPGIGAHHNFSSKKMRSKGGYEFILECIKKLEKNHMKHMKYYSNELWTNKLRLSGKFETAPWDKFSWGVADRTASIRLQRSTKATGKGYMEDRRPGGDCDPYIVCGLLLETCLGGTKGGDKNECCNPCKPCK